MAAVDPALVARFRADLETAVRHPVAVDERLALAVSGGPDSMAMLALAAEALPEKVIAATVDHGLRTASVDEASLVVRWCTNAGVPHQTLRIAAPPPTGNLHVWARRERYAVLGRWAVDAGATMLATAHHADDQAETFLMRAARGSGLAGLSAIRACQRMEIASPGDTVSHPLTLVRPLLGWRRAELRAVATAVGLPFVDDPSNSDERFDRARYRAWLAQAPWLDMANIARTAHILAETDSDLTALTELLWRERTELAATGESRVDITGLPRDMRRRIARLAIGRVLTALDAAPDDIPANIEPLLDALDAGKSASQGPVLASAKGAIWHFRAAPPRRSL